MDTDNSGNIDFTEFEKAVVSNTKLSQLLLASPLFDNDEVVMTSAKRWTPPPGGGMPALLAQPARDRRPSQSGAGAQSRLFGIVDIRNLPAGGVFGRSHNEFVCKCSAVQPVALRTMRFSHAHSFHRQLSSALVKAGLGSADDAMLTIPPKLMNWGALTSNGVELNQRRAGLERFFNAALANPTTRKLTVRFMAEQPELHPMNHGAALGMMAT